MAFTGVVPTSSRNRSGSFVLVDGELKAELEEAYRFIDEDDDNKPTKSQSPLLPTKHSQDTRPIQAVETRENGIEGQSHFAVSSTGLGDALVVTEDLAMSDTAKEVIRALQKKDIKAVSGVQTGKLIFLWFESSFVLLILSRG
jgi:hypothetical protein